MSLKLNSSGGGSVTLQEPSTATNGTLTLPAGTGTVAVNGLSSNIVSGTAVASTSGTSIDFTGIPSWVKRITVMFDDVSTNGTSNLLVQLGDAGGFETTGYVSSGATYTPTPAITITSSTAGFILAASLSAANAVSGLLTICTISTNNWVENANGKVGSGGTFSSGGSKTLSATLTQIRITTSNGTDTFDAGSINILYE